jgi:hypothetical protein
MFLSIFNYLNMLNLANEDYQLLYTPLSSAIPSQSPQKIEQFSTKNLALTKKVLTTILTLIQSSCTLTGATFIFGQTVMQPTSTKCLCQSMSPFRETDNSICQGQFVDNNSGAIIPCSCQANIQSAGQNKSLGN